MANIKVMDASLANKIAAGEVVERTMNVVKELVENSIDAKSTRIEITLEDAGVKRIVVQDNGKGMSKEDAHLAFLRHATSKITQLEDLFHVTTLGFRGEALPSIASVSHVSLLTSDGKEGTFLKLEEGKIKEESSSSLVRGTTITVEQLFYNTPVRLKYLKNLYTELALITDYINKMALSYPSIQFILKNNDKQLLNTTGDGNLLKVIYEIYGIEVAKKMLPLALENEDYRIEGYMSYPEVARTNRNVMTTLVNGRVIRNSVLNRVILDAYHTYIPKDKFPILIMNIEVDPILIDINIHPTKMDIKFSKMDTLKELLTKGIVENLKKTLLIPHASVRTQETIEEVLQNSPPPAPKPFLDFVEDNYEVKENETTQLHFETETMTNRQETEEEETEEVTSNQDAHATIKRMFPVGVVHTTYIIAENEEGMFIIDQHAAAERINYEKYLKELSKETTELVPLLVPLSLEFSNEEYLLIKEKLDQIKDLGIICEEFGQNTLVIREHPTWFVEGKEKETLQKIMEILQREDTFSKEKFIEKTAITLACRMSIKANDYVSIEDMQYLLDTLTACKNPFTCPHGRPTIIAYSKYDLEKMFKRSAES